MQHSLVLGKQLGLKPSQPLACGSCTVIECCPGTLVGSSIIVWPIGENTVEYFGWAGYTVGWPATALAAAARAAAAVAPPSSAGRSVLPGTAASTPAAAAAVAGWLAATSGCRQPLADTPLPAAPPPAAAVPLAPARSAAAAARGLLLLLAGVRGRRAAVG